MKQPKVTVQLDDATIGVFPVVAFYWQTNSNAAVVDIEGDRIWFMEKDNIFQSVIEYNGVNLKITLWSY
jgi:hypothetical protein